MNNKQEKTIRRYVFLATTLLAIASLAVVGSPAAESQEGFAAKKNKIEGTDNTDIITGTQEMTR